MVGDRNVITLRHRAAGFGAMEMLAVPRCGGALAGWSLDRSPDHAGSPDRIDLFRRASGAALNGSFAPDMACFPLVPFSNRIGGARFVFQGREVAMATDPGSPHRIHGHGWSSPWRVESVSDHALRMGFEHPASDWPWSYSAFQTVALDDDGLTVTLELVNRSDGDMPAGLGLHPYFATSPGSRVTASVRGVWENDDTILPARRIPLPPAWDFPQGVVMDGVALDNGFTGWDGRATLDRPRDGLRLTMLADGPAGHLIVYAPADESYVCLEPVTHMTDALNRPGEPDAGVIALPPGERLALTIRVLLSRL